MVGAQATVHSERRGDQLNTAKANKQEERRAGTRPNKPHPAQHTTTGRDDDRRGNSHSHTHTHHHTHSPLLQGRGGKERGEEATPRWPRLRRLLDRPPSSSSASSPSSLPREATSCAKKDWRQPSCQPPCQAWQRGSHPASTCCASSLCPPSFSSSETLKTPKQGGPKKVSRSQGPETASRGRTLQKPLFFGASEKLF